MSYIYANWEIPEIGPLWTYADVTIILDTETLNFKILEADIFAAWLGKILNINYIYIRKPKTFLRRKNKKKKKTKYLRSWNKITISSASNKVPHMNPVGFAIEHLKWTKIDVPLAQSQIPSHPYCKVSRMQSCLAQP